MKTDMKQCVCIVELEHVASEQERQKIRQASPHPRVEAFDRYVHIVPGSESLQTVKHATLISELQILNDA